MCRGKLSLTQCLDLCLCLPLVFINADNILASIRWVTSYGSANCDLGAGINFNGRSLVPATSPADGTRQPWMQRFAGLTACEEALWWGWLQACQAETAYGKKRESLVLNTVTWAWTVFRGMSYLLGTTGNFPWEERFSHRWEWLHFL